MTLKTCWETLPCLLPCAVLIYPAASQSDSEDGRTNRTGVMQCVVQKLGCSSESARVLIKTQTVGLHAQTFWFRMSVVT